jgi:hypothetical protein
MRLRNESIHKAKEVKCKLSERGRYRIKKHSCSSLCAVTIEAHFGCTYNVFTKVHEMCKY